MGLADPDEAAPPIDTGIKVLKTWVAIMRSDGTTPGTRAHVGDLIYSRAYGKPTPDVAASSGPIGIVILPAEEEP